jgi:hypothetical protein
VHESIQIIEPDFMTIVESSNAPPFGGWLTLYPYEIVLEGKLHCSDNLPFPAILDSITVAYLIGEEGERYQLTMQQFQIQTVTHDTV